MRKNKNELRDIPQVEKLLQIDEIDRYIPLIGRSIVIKSIREEIELFREGLKENKNLETSDLISSISNKLNRKKSEKLQRVINGTGVLIHTNLGRAPISKRILENLQDALSGYCNLELNLPTGKRGNRGGFAEELICDLTNAEDALIVNNNASSLFLILSEFGKGKDVIISRGELVQIGGGFRIPDIMRQTGVNLVEVGTTNITELDDYRRAITDNTSMILSVHPSNYKIEGFSRSPSLKDLSTLKNSSILFVRDLGSGNLFVDARFPKTFEPTISSELSQNPDIICFSGDKMLGGCQAGIIVGRGDLIRKLKNNPLMRMFRVDKITYHILQESFIQYSNKNLEEISLWNIIFQNKKIIGNKVNRLLKKIKVEDKKTIFTRVPLKSIFGGGALPTVKIESMGLQISIPNVKGEEIYRKLIYDDVPIVGYILDDKYTLDFRAIFDEDIPIIAEALGQLIEFYSGC
ncbi:MAG: L-seryl-tRNA(Sec) selenium transferase [Spirochaetota bacterium]|nr:L-seryl-tRNA(Sec) selenium transferase [Spirochaetota bacterium]